MYKVRYHVRPEDLGKRLLKRARALPQEMARGYKAATRYSLMSLRMRTIAARKVDTGAMLRGWAADTQNTGGDLLVTLHNESPHHVNVEKGRRAGAAMPPYKPIAAWALRKFGSTGPAWAIMRAIAKRGIRPTKIMTSVAFRRKARELYRRETTKALSRAARKR